MPEEVGNPQAGAATSPQVGTDGTQAVTSAQQQPVNGQQQQGQQTSNPPGANEPPRTQITDLTVLQRELDEARREAGEFRTQLRQFQDRDLTEQQRVARDRDEAREHLGEARGTIETLQTENRTLRAETVLLRNGCRRPELIASLMTDDQLATEDTQKEAIKTLRKSYPELFTIAGVQGSADGASTGSAPRNPGTMNNMIRGARGVPPAQ